MVNEFSGFVVIAAFRYALGRSTAAPRIISEWILTLDLPPDVAAMIVEETGDAIRQKVAGQPCDVQTWESMMHKLKARHEEVS